jgi:hypothetical protein
MTPKEINQAVNITAKFAEQRLLCKQARKAIMEARFAMLADCITEEEKAILFRAEELLEKIADVYGYSYTLKYINNLHD